MGAITTSIRNYLDTISEVVGIKAGILLSYDEIREVLKQKYDDWFIAEPNIDLGMRIRSEEFDSHIRFIRYRLGNLTKDMLNPFLASDRLIKYIDKGIDPSPAIHYLRSISAKYKNQKVDPLKIIEEIVKGAKVSRRLATDVVLMVADHQFQSSDILPPETEEWDGGTPLSNLFKMEIKSKEKDFVDQKFLDYLAVNQHKLTEIHWRNFERFCAEFFKKSGYEIKLGPGTNDGGIDIRAYDKKHPEKPLIVIQCKRYSENNKVEIETVKAFYTDVEFEKAVHGVIVTTSYIAAGGKRISNARKYPLSFIENEEVKQIAQSMWRYAKR